MLFLEMKKDGLINRRRFLNSIFATSCFFSIKCHCSDAAFPEMKPFDEEIENFIHARRIPGASLAVFNNGSLIYEKGYGFANIKDKTGVIPATLFRIASLSKPITAAGILKLVEQRRLTLDTPVVEFFDGIIENWEKKITDKRWYKITVRRLLQHSGGWDSAISGDPMFFSDKKIASGLGRLPEKPADVVEFMLSRPLDFDPGSRYAYSNFGYCLLGRVIEKIASTTYENYIKQNVLKPLGIKNMHIGATLFEKKRPDEAVYYTAFNNEEMKTFPSAEIANPYGSFNLERMDAHGGWISTASDYARFCISFTKNAKVKILSNSGLNMIVSPPEYAVGNDKSQPETYYGLGWLVRPLGKNGNPNLWHHGSLPGSYAFAAILGDGSGWVALFNGRSSDENNLPNAAIDSALHRAAAKVKRLSEN